ncbi:MAG: hypothetical protein ABIF85_04320 [Nanoarchaeota archaeon]|nr:hypothetical protein [Nanoarchaeota archaeon]MBU4300626.1 hypothetical protein [Nanoarchaeota archaeon]MBU4452179.1 hypothetical protein [Nanoarchaeota archaeon]MCG2724219.1 hypothetical protein [archaeon]
MAYQCKVCKEKVDVAEHCGQPCDEVNEEVQQPQTEAPKTEAPKTETQQV